MYAHLKQAITYILKPEKTLGGLYTAGWNCSCESALEEMIHTKQQYGKEPDPEKKSYKNNRLASHFVISWSPKEGVPPETAMEITRKFVEEYLPGYEAVCSAHIDTEHMHTHIIFNSVNYKTGRKYHCPVNEWEKNLQPLLDRLCKEQGLHTLEEDTGISISDYIADRGGKKPSHTDTDNAEKRGRKYESRGYEKESRIEYTFSDYLREDIDMLIEKSRNFEMFEQNLKEMGYEIAYGNSEKFGTYMKIRGPEMKRFRRTHTLGSDYTLDMIKSRMDAWHRELPEDTADVEKSLEHGKYIVFGRVYRCTIRFGTDNLYLRKQYARMYRLGILPRAGTRLPYRERTKRIQMLRKLEYQLNLIAENDYRTPDDIKKEIAGCEQHIEDLQEELKRLRKKKKPYQKMLAVYEELEALEGAYLLFSEGDTAFAQKAAAYEDLKGRVEHYPHTKEELDSCIADYEAQEKKLKGKLYARKKKRKACLELQEEYQQVMMEYAPASEKMLADMERHGAKAEAEQKKSRGKER